MKNLSEQGITPQTWEAFVSACHNSPMNVDLQNIQDILDSFGKID